MIAGLPYAKRRDPVLTHPTFMEGWSVPSSVTRTASATV